MTIFAGVELNCGGECYSEASGSTFVVITFLAVSTVLAFAAYMVGGRLAGLILKASCSAAMAFFVIPAVFSFRTSRASDAIARAFGAAGLALAKKAPPK
jgi:hypothetical protein